MTTHLIKPGQIITNDIRLRCGMPASQVGDDLLGTEDNITSVDCVGCLHDLIIDMRLELLDDTAESRWLAGDDCGVSSKTIWSVMTGRPVGKRHRPSVPHDPADFGRCHRLLEMFPGWRPRMWEVVVAHPEWSGLVDAWDELTALYNEEYPTGSGPKLFARMTEIDREWRSTPKECGGKRVPTHDPALSPGLTMRRCVRCGCTSAYDTDEARNCPVLRETSTWKPRPTSDGRWTNAEEDATRGDDHERLFGQPRQREPIDNTRGDRK